MSYGFIRKMSPAARSERERRKARRLKGIVIDEVSSVDRGAGRGVTVQLLKRDRAERKPMNTPLQYAEAAVKAVTAGRISQFGLNVIIKGLCQDVSGGDMNKFLYQTPVGAVFLRPRETRTSTAEEYDLQKSEGHNAAVDYYGGAGPLTVDYNDDRQATAAYRREKAFGKRVDAAGSGRQYQPGQNGDGMDIDWNDDAQATKAYRAEKAAKARDAAQARESDLGSHQGENGNPIAP
jgi:hypothetical protein